MTTAEAAHRGWVLLSMGLVCLFLTVLQLVAKRAFRGFWGSNPWVYLKQDPILFWINVVPLGALGLFFVGLALTLLLR